LLIFATLFLSNTIETSLDVNYVRNVQYFNLFQSLEKHLHTNISSTMDTLFSKVDF
jgi:hypothetical protein